MNNDRKPISNQTENAWGKTINEFEDKKHMKENETPLKEDRKPTFSAMLGRTMAYFIQIAFIFAIVLIVVKLLTMLYFWMF